MTKQGKLIWGLLAGVLVLLFLLSSTDLIIKEKKTEIYPVSVIIGDTTDDYYTNFRKGVDMAADEYNVDVNFITLYEKGDVREQMELLKREIDDGVKAVVLVPLKQQACSEMLDGMALGSPLVVMGNIFPGDWAMSGISQDYQETGRMLGEAIARENAPDKPVLVFTEGLEYGYNKEVYGGLLAALSQAGFHARLYEKYKDGIAGASAPESGDIFRRTIEETLVPKNGEAVIVGLDVQSLDSAAGIIAGNPVYGNYAPSLYGIGSTTKILNQMDRGVIKGLVVTNQFDAGYLSIVKAVEAIGQSGDREQIVLDSYYIEKDDLRETRFEKILYPIE